MRSKLLKSFLVVVIFWWVATALYWSVADPMKNLHSLQQISHLASYVGIRIDTPVQANVLDALRIQIQVLKLWTLPLFGLTVLATLIGVGAIWHRAMKSHQARVERVAPAEDYRGVSVSLGPLPLPQVPFSKTVTLRSTNESLKALSDEERVLLQDVLGFFAGNPDAFAGENRQAGTLLPTTLALVNKALLSRNNPGLAAIAAAAGELGKITAWKQDEDGWRRVKNESREAARILAALPNWYSMPATERTALLFAVKYKGKPGLMPEIGKDPNVYRLARSLMDAETQTSQTVIEEARAKVYEQRDPETELLECFERELALLPFQSPGLPKNIPAVGWKKNGRAYLLENRLADSLLPKLPLEVRTAFVQGTRDKSARITPMTAAFLRIFAAKGWLVVENGKDKVAATEALWVIGAGKLDFSRVIILDLPPDLQEKLPAKDSYYEVVVKRPQFQSAVAAQSAVSKDDLMGGMLRPKSTAPKAPDAPAQQGKEVSTGDSLPS